MKIADLKPCGVCGGPVIPVFYEVALTQHLVDAAAVNRHLGLAQYFGGGARGNQLAEVMGPNEDGSAVISEHRIVVCMGCMAEHAGQLLAAIEDAERTAAEIKPEAPCSPAK